LEGNTCYPEAELLVEAAKMLDVPEELIKEGLKVLEVDRHIVREEMDGAFYIWIAPLYASKRESSKKSSVSLTALA